MASETLFSAFVNSEFLRFFRMVYCRAVTVLALDYCMGCFAYGIILVIMAILAVFRPLVFYFEILPELFIILVVQSVHVSTLLNTEIGRNIEISYN